MSSRGPRGPRGLPEGMSYADFLLRTDFIQSVHTYSDKEKLECGARRTVLEIIEEFTMGELCWSSVLDLSKDLSEILTKMKELK